ncbi:MAG: hypothetical protein JSW39_03615 [Desulfobacterales bacterium]|nr:MAG: hypothetical protein JSW39_03615 [Desulfobacterales bacterium]
MQCVRCHQRIEKGEEKEHHGQVLCEDCYMDALSPARACDPWAVHSAKSFERQKAGPVELNATQQKILDILKDTGGIPPGALVERLQIKPADLEREIAALRHMEKVRGELRQGQKFIRLW